MSDCRVLLVCEGPEDLAVFRALLTRLGFKKGPQQPSPPAGEVRKEDLLSGERNLQVSVRAVGGKSSLVTACRNALDGMSPTNPIHRIGVNFDPDNDTDAAWNTALFQNGWEPVLSHESDGTYRRDSIPVIPLPWEGGTPVFDHLEDHQSLERLMMGAFRHEEPELFHVLEGWLNQLDGISRSRNPVEGKRKVHRSWKTAARLMAGILFPGQGVPGAAEQFFGQDPKLWERIAPELRETRLWASLERLLSPATPE